MRVFVSSTYDDLIDHRAALDDIIRRLSAQFRGMELFGSRPFEPKRVCFDEISSCDVFVGVYAHRYGWIPHGDSLSITEQEFDYARSTNRPCYCYVVDPDHPWNPQFIEVSALDKIKRFHTKVGTLVRSKFTTPDNLAKQVAVDLVAAFASRYPARNKGELLAQLRTNIAHEISIIIGLKYIRDLYVDRALDRNLQLRLQEPARVSSAATKAVNAVRRILPMLEPLFSATPPPDDTVSSREAALRATSDILELVKRTPTDPSLNYPAATLCDALQQMKSLITNVERLQAAHIRRLGGASTWPYNIDTHLASANAAIGDALTVIKPVYLIVDRAGGGKTNLLCHLAEVFVATHPTFFIAARSVPTATCDGIRAYVAAAYPISEDPIQSAVQTIVDSDSQCIVIVDGINEHPDASAFNLALKTFIRQYYHKPVKFLISCRDIYWRYFEDDWWLSHGAFVARDALYSFTHVEYDKALPRYMRAFDIDMELTGKARDDLRHPLLLRFFCEAYRGTPAAPTQAGRLNEIRLLELFDAYCIRKFDQIRARLGLLDANEIATYLTMIALAMVDLRTRTLPVGTVAQKARIEFGERSRRTVDSRYVQILDEDILIEERPVQSLSETVVTFVYDEFMEYMIARAVWERAVTSSDDVLNAIAQETALLLPHRTSFISITGIVLYLGEMLARISEQHLLGYLNVINAHKAADLAFEVAVKTARQSDRRETFLRVLAFHRDGTSAERRRALDAIGQLAPAHWKSTLDYLRTPVQADRLIPGQSAFSTLKRASVHIRRTVRQQQRRGWHSTVMPTSRLVSRAQSGRSNSGSHVRVVVVNSSRWLTSTCQSTTRSNFVKLESLKMVTTRTAECATRG